MKGNIKRESTLDRIIELIIIVSSPIASKIALFVGSVSISRFPTFWVMRVLFWYHVFCLVRDDALWDSAGADKSCPLYHNFPHIKHFFEIFFWSSKRQLSIANDNDFVPKNMSCNFLLSFTLVDQSNKKRTPASKWSFFLTCPSIFLHFL